jgi:hypothetical protein
MGPRAWSGRRSCDPSTLRHPQTPHARTHTAVGRMRARTVAMAVVLLAAAAANASGNFGARRPSPGGALPLGNCRGSSSSRGGGVQRLRGGFEAVMPLKPGNLGKPNAWSGQNLGELTTARRASVCLAPFALCASCLRTPER